MDEAYKEEGPFDAGGQESLEDRGSLDDEPLREIFLPALELESCEPPADPGAAISDVELSTQTTDSATKYPRQTTPSRLRWVQPAVEPHEMSTRRTGVAFLGLILTTNCVPWTQLARGSADGPAFVSFAESLLVVAMCLGAASLVVAAWFLGRRLPQDRGPRIARPRDTGLMLAVLAAGQNLLLAAIIHFQGAGGPSSLRLFGAIWLVLALPTQVAAGFCKGRASIPLIRPVEKPAGPSVPVAAAGEPVSSPAR